MGRKRKNFLCVVDECGRAALADQLCAGHYHRKRRYGSVTGKRTRLNGTAWRFLNDVVLHYEGDQCLSWPFARNRQGYGIIGSVSVHREICRRAHGAPPTTKHQVAHSCGRGHEGCCAKRHLRWDTAKGNNADKLKHGTIHRGKRNGNAKLNVNEVLLLRELYGMIAQKDLAAMLGVSQSTVSRVQRTLRWGWL